MQLFAGANNVEPDVGRFINLCIPLLHTPPPPLPNRHSLRALVNLLPSQGPPHGVLGATIYVQTQPAIHCVPNPHAKPTHVTLHRLPYIFPLRPR